MCVSVLPMARSGVSGSLWISNAQPGNIGTRHTALYLMRWVIFIAFIAGAVLAQTAEEPVYKLGPGITPPRVIHQVEPNPKKDAGGFRISGTVLVGLIVSSHGEPKDVRVVQSLQKDVDQSAVDAVKEWRFEPAKKDGMPVAVRVTVEIRFHDL